MKKSLSPIAYETLFLKHVWGFLSLFVPKEKCLGRHAVAVSGGADSMVLLWVAHKFYERGELGEVRGLFVHHHTRPGQDEEELVVKNFCSHLGIPFKKLSVENLSPHEGNFEARARKKRQELLLNELTPGELLWMGHHLDDSYEWSFMQRHRSGNLLASLGIPVRNHSIIRPFLCVTRAQIRRLQVYREIPFREDPTNMDLIHERNYLRSMILPEIQKKYPKFLKFYAHQSNTLAETLQKTVIKDTKKVRVITYRKGAVVEGEDFSLPTIQDLIHRYSHFRRGSIVTTIERMLKAIQEKKKGPFQFSGGVEIYSTPGLLMIYPQGFKNHDEFIANNLKAPGVWERILTLPPLTKSELENSWERLLKNSDALYYLPGVVLVLGPDSVSKTLNASASLGAFPKVSEFCRTKEIKLTTVRKCLDTWESKAQKLPEKLRIIPIYELIHLFTFQ